MDDSAPNKIAVILPALNEQATIVETIRSFATCLPGASIWVIDNNSDDATSRVAAEEIERLKAPGGVLLESRRGKGHAVRRAFRDIEADVYVLADADMTLSLPRFRGHPNWRECSPGVLHGEARKDRQEEAAPPHVHARVQG